VVSYDISMGAGVIRKRKRCDGERVWYASGVVEGGVVSSLPRVGGLVFFAFVRYDGFGGVVGVWLWLCWVWGV